jgi:hypothetical protein
MNILQLPIEILTKIAATDLDTFRAAVLTLEIGALLCCDHSQNYAQKKFTEIKRSGPLIKYYCAGKLHRKNGPAVIREDDGYNAYYIAGKRHRKDGPAVIVEGYSAYYIDGKRHRENGPARIRANNDIEYYINDKLHREDGPAMQYAGGSIYYLHGKKYINKYEYEIALEQMRAQSRR